MLTKSKVISEIEKFPEKFSIDELIEKLILIEKIELGREQSKRGDIVSEDELDYEINKWFE